MHQTKSPRLLDDQSDASDKSKRHAHKKACTYAYFDRLRSSHLRTSLSSMLKRLYRIGQSWTVIEMTAVLLYKVAIFGLMRNLLLFAATVARRHSVR
jgi:hypothetical protein